ncbi:MAG: hypothetical protein QM728_02255 [Gordonia sp. (in: high G+C Gram-positive bacteria)]|uniref:tautomerase family protein n=1 Tax=Gordonia sp. (in: high G+C Gram-positive bacteria) TaxID=84139 RepID=UPI0039E714EC
MPLLRVTVTPGAFDEEQRHRLVAALTDAACRAESVPDEPKRRALALALVDEPGQFYSAGAPAADAVAGAFVEWQVSAGVLDAARKEQFARDLQACVEELAGPARLAVTSCIVTEVPEGQWAQNGAIRRLPEMARTGGFGHLELINEPRR